MKTSQIQKQSDCKSTKPERFKLLFDSVGFRRVRGLQATLVDSQSLWSEKLLQLKVARVSSSCHPWSHQTIHKKKARFFDSKPSFLPLWRKNEQKTCIDRFANLIMCGSFTKGAKKSGKKTLAYKLFCNSLLQYKYQIDSLPAKGGPLFDARLHYATRSILETTSFSSNKVWEKVNNRVSGQPINSTSKQEFKKILLDVQFNVETRKVRIGGATYQVPSIIKNSRKEGLAMRSLISCATSNKRAGAQTFDSTLSLEFVAVRNKESSSRQKRDKIHNNALSHRAYVRYRWW